MQKKLSTVEHIMLSRSTKPIIIGCPHLFNTAFRRIPGSMAIIGAELDVPEREERLLGESGAGGGHGEHEGGDAKGGVDRHEAGAERGSGALAAEQQQEAEETHHELK